MANEAEVQAMFKTMIQEFGTIDILANVRPSSITPSSLPTRAFRDYVLFHEYFHGDTGRGVGARHQTGWTGLIAKLLQRRRKSTSTKVQIHRSP